MNISGNNPEFGPGIFLPSDVSAMERFFGSDDEDAVLARTLVENAKRFGLSMTSSGTIPGQDPLRPERLWEYMFAAKRATKGKTLECGGASSIMPSLLAAKGHDVTTIDLNEAMVRNQESLSMALGINVRTMIADMMTLPFETGEFDTVVSISVIEHVSDRRTALREMSRVLRPGGELFLTFDYSTKKYEGWNPYMSAEEVNLEVSEAGLKMEPRLILPPLVIFCGSYTFARIIATKPLEKK